MKFRHQLRYQLVRLCETSYAQADFWIQSGRVRVQGEKVEDPFTETQKWQSIELDDQTLRTRIQYHYLLWYKPIGIECTQQVKVENNLQSVLPEEFHGLFPLGRLDFNSEGLLLLTNDGDAYKRWMQPGAEVEKEYEVETRDPVNDALRKAFENPFQLGPRWTLPAEFLQTGANSFRVILKEGINRQIRRICAKNQNQVVRLKRIRFGPYLLEDMSPNAYRLVDSF